MIIELTDDEIGILLSTAAHVPAMHNARPCRFEVHGPVIDALVDPVPDETLAGSSVRATHLGVGAAVLNLRVAAAMLGHQTHFATLPDPARPEIKARIFLAGRGSPVAELSHLYGETTRRHLIREQLVDRPIQPRIRRVLDRAARAEEAKLHWLETPARSRLDALLRQTTDADAGGFHSFSTRGPQRRAFAGYGYPYRTGDLLDRTTEDLTGAAVAVLITRDEDEDAWIRAGMALQRVLLVATSHGLAATYLDQLTERTETRAQVRRLVAGHWPQMVLRIGYPAQSNGHTGRRDWHEPVDRWF
ncbi:nitroreductase family protein [Kribbella sp. NPDC048915]|uniref:nitroreductase family protein n=1 Tax=Kribbella sp. NPDC048915 TaxID=3155148 RepID=UPI0033CA5799